MEPETLAQGVRVSRAPRELGEDPELDRAEERLGAPEGGPEVEDAVGREVGHGTLG